MAVGLVTPRIVLPQRLLAPGEEHALDSVLRHEMAHVRRGDAWLSTGMQLGAIAAWPVIPVWFAVARIRQLIELACDEAALDGANASERRRYGHALLDMAEWQLRSVAPFGAGELHFGATLRARIEALASQRHWSAATQAVVLSLATFALIGACSGSSSPVAATAVSSPAAAADETSYGYEFEVDSAKNSLTDSSALSLPHADGDRVPPETVQAIVRAHYGAFSRCYEAGITRNPGLAGTASVKLLAGKDGTTRQAIDEGSTLHDAAVVACIVREFATITFPRSGGELTILYPIQFAP